MSVGAFAEVTIGDSPILGTAIHHGHEVREELASLMVLREADRLREEDPHTGRWTTVAGSRIIVQRSRFEVDLNRARTRAVYLKPADAWGLRIWKARPPADAVARSLHEYDAFYAKIRTVLSELERRFGHFVVFDLHSYNHRRAGATAPPADPATHPDLNIGTGTLDRARWGRLVDRVMADLARVDVVGRTLDVRENVVFRGGHLSRWIHEAFPASACVLAVEVKKFFMDEWTGAPDETQIQAVERALAASVPGVLEELRKL